MWAAIWAGFSIGFVGIGATMTYPHPSLSPETSVAIAAVSFAAAAGCFARAIWYGLVGVPTLEGVTWRQYVQARERQQKEIVAQGVEIAELRSVNDDLKRRLSSVEATGRDAPRQLSPAAREIIAGQLRGLVSDWKFLRGPQAGITIYYQPGPDCASYAQEFSDLLASLGLKVFCSVLRPEYVSDGDITSHRFGIFIIDGPRPTFGDWLHEAMADAGVSSQRLFQDRDTCVVIVGEKAAASK
jgi:hypothetical protein